MVMIFWSEWNLNKKTLRVKKDLSGTTYEEITMAQKKEGPPTRETLDYMFEKRGKKWQVVTGLSLQ